MCFKKSQVVTNIVRIVMLTIILTICVHPLSKEIGD